MSTDDDEAWREFKADSENLVNTLLRLAARLRDEEGYLPDQIFAAMICAAMNVAVTEHGDAKARKMVLDMMGRIREALSVPTQMQ